MGAASRRSWTTTICLRLKLTASSTTTTTSTSQTWIATRPSGNQKRSRITSRRFDLFAIRTLGIHIQNDHGMSQNKTLNIFGKTGFYWRSCVQQLSKMTQEAIFEKHFCHLL